MMLRLYLKSPVTLASEIDIPVLMFLGAQDRRVPHQQGLEMHRALKAKAKDVTVRRYDDDCHPLAKVKTNADLMISAAMFFFKSIRSAGEGE